MSGFRILCEEEEFSPDSARALEGALEGTVDADLPLAVEIEFAGEEEIRRLNREMRGTDRVTDVLSFPALEGIKGRPLRRADFPFDLDEEGELFLGSIAVCTSRAREQAEEYGHSFERELFYLIVHGIMHCLGYDHERDEDRAEMRQREELVLKKLGLTRDE